MSSTTGISRTRSVRNPTVTANDSASDKPGAGRNDARNTSPSRLPMRPPTTRSATSSTTASSSTTTARTRASTSSTSRQVSGSSTTKATSRSATQTVASTTKSLVRAPSVRQAPSTARTATTTTTTTNGSSNGIGRSASTTTRPRSSAGLPSANPQRERHLGHSRAKSTVTSLTAATTLRPGSHAPARSTPSPAPSTASSTSTSTRTTHTGVASSTRTQTRLQAQHARTASQSSATATTLAARRPAFNTNQQHYSPAKSSAPKPLTATFLAPPSPSKQPVNVALTAETSRLQTELLQLSLLHREAHSVSDSWHASARSKLETRFQELVTADEALRALERDGAEERGLQDLVRWADAIGEPFPHGHKRTKSRARRETLEADRNRLPLDEKIRLLDQVLNGAWALGEPGGRYQRTVRAFEEWASRVAEIRAAQQGGDMESLLARSGGREEDVNIFVSDLDASAWKRDHAGLVRMLEGWRRTLAQLGHPDANESAKGKNEDAGTNKPPSGLARTLGGCHSLVNDMLAELKVMEQIELDALSAEEDWMEQMEERLNAEGKVDPRTDEVPPWKMLAL